MALHDINDQSRKNPVLSSAVLYVDHPTRDSKILLKVTKILIRNGNKAMWVYGVLDDRSERTIIIHDAVHKLKLKGGLSIAHSQERDKDHSRGSCKLPSFFDGEPS